MVGIGGVLVLALGRFLLLDGRGYRGEVLGCSVGISVGGAKRLPLLAVMVLKTHTRGLSQARHKT